MVTVVVVAVVIALVVLPLLGLFGGTTIYDRRVAAAASPWFGTGAGVHIKPLRHSSLLADRLAQVQWNRAARRGINHGRCLLDEAGLHWAPSRLTNRRVPSFEVYWREISRYDVKPGIHVLGRQVAKVDLTLADGTSLSFASSDPQGWLEALNRFVRSN